MDEISRKILCVDDEPNILDGLRRHLRRFDVTIADAPGRALEIVREQGPFAVVISDNNMPGMTGIEFLRHVHEISPDTITIMLSGCDKMDVAVDALRQGRIFRFLSKPCSPDAMITAVNESLEQYRLIVGQRLLTEELRELNQRLEDRVRERTSTIARLYQFVSEMGQMDSVEQVAEVVVRTAANMLDSRRVSIMIPDASGENLTIVAATGITQEVKDRIRVPIGEPLAGQVFSEAESIIFNETDGFSLPNPRYDDEFFAVVPLMSSALMSSGQPIGVINVTEPNHGGPYGDLALATLKAISESAAVAIQNQVRLQQRNEARDAIILALARLAEYRDPETGAHLERVQIYCRMLCEMLARTERYNSLIDADYISAIVQSSPLHDIGKVGIPDRILLKPGRLTPEEFEVMKTHTTVGGNTIRGLVQQQHGQRFLNMGMEIAYCHHEKFDGSGYPAGLVGGSIPLPARILAVADVYDALTSRRVYKPPMIHEESAAIIRDGSGKHFDPDVVEAFFNRQADFDRIANELRDNFPNEAESLPAPALVEPVGASS